MKSVQTILAAAILLMVVTTPLSVLQAQLSQLPYTVPVEKQVRVIVSTDAANEVDDAYFILHALLTPQFDVRGVVAAHFGGRQKQDMEKSYDECRRLLDVAGFTDKVALLHGAGHRMECDTVGVPSEGSDLIVGEALRDDPRPLYILCGGPLTDVATALLQTPGIAKRLTVVWTGGADPKLVNGGWCMAGGQQASARDFNLCSDMASVNAVLGSDAALWQIPSNVYGTVRTGSAELALKVKPCGRVGQYLWNALMQFNESHRTSRGWPRGEDWTLGDSPLVTVLMATHAGTDKFDVVPAPHITEDLKYEIPVPAQEVMEGEIHTIRIYRSIDVRMVLEDFFSKLQLAYGNQN